MLGSIGFERYRIRCVIGARARERHVEQEIFVDLKVETDISAAVKSDAIQDTVDYSRLAEFCREKAVNGRYLLLEKYAADTAKAIKEEFGVKSVSICVRKPAALKEAECAYVSLKVE